MEEKPIKKGISEAQKKASKKYLENNRDKINQQRKRYYIERKEKDPEFLKYKRDKAKEYYNKHLKNKPKVIEDKPIETPKEDIKVEDKKNLNFDIKF